MKPNNHVDQFLKDPKKSLYKLAYPVLIALFVQTLYNIVDTIYVGRLGARSIAALSFSFPLFFILMSINSGIATGMRSKISYYLGQNKKKLAENTALHGLIISYALALIISTLGLIFLEQLFILFGAEAAVIMLAVDYMSMILLGTFFMFPAFIYNNIFSAYGDTKTPMKIQIISLIINIILDPIFIYGLDMGVKGAGLATTISFIVSLLLSIYYIRQNPHLNIKMSSFKYDKNIIKEIFKIGIPASVTMIFISIYVIFINYFMSSYSTNHVAAFGLVSRLENIVIMPIVAIAMSLITLVGMYYGAKRIDLVKQITFYSIKASIYFTVAMGLIFFMLPKLFLLMFTNDPDILMIGSSYMRVNVFTFPLMAIIMVVSRALQGLGNGLPSLVINLIRIFVVAIPLASLFVFILKLDFIFVAYAMVLGGIVSSIAALVWLKIEMKRKCEKYNNDC